MSFSYAIKERCVTSVYDEGRQFYYKRLCCYCEIASKQYDRLFRNNKSLANIKETEAVMKFNCALFTGDFMKIVLFCLFA